MYLNDSAPRSSKGNVLISWQFIILQVLMLLGAAVYLDKPTGSLAGTIALQQEKFGLYSYDLSKHKAYAIAIGPRGKSINCLSASITLKFEHLALATSMWRIFLSAKP